MKNWEQLLLFLFLFFASVFTQSSCTSSNPINGMKFDLSPLTVNGSNYYTAKYSNGHLYYWNICGTVTSEYCTTFNGTSVCQLSGGKEFSYGIISSQTITQLSSTGLFIFFQ